MFDWLINGVSSWLYPSSVPDHIDIDSIENPASLPYSASRILLMKQTDAPYLNNYWDYPSRGSNMPEIVYSDKLSHMPLFSSKTQIIGTVDSGCAGKLLFTQSLHPEKLSIDTVDSSILIKPPLGSSAVISKVDAPERFKCAVDMLPVNFRVGGAGPGGPEMSAKLLSGTSTSSIYQKLGPHYIGNITNVTDTQGLPHSAFCVEPSAVDMKSMAVRTVYGPGVEPDGIIKVL